MAIYVYIAIAMLVACVVAYSAQSGERLNEPVEIVLVAVVWPLWVASYVLTVVFEYWVGEQDLDRRNRRR
jgi:hypothetical protein